MTGATPVETRIGRIDPTDPIVRALISRHMTFSQATTIPENVFALSPEDLAQPGILLFGLHQGPALAAIGALRPLAAGDCELKSFHVAREFRGRGLARTLLQYLIEEARSRCFSRIRLETGSGEAYTPARQIFTTAGFLPSGPFGDYPEAEESAFFMLELLPEE